MEIAAVSTSQNVSISLEKNVISGNGGNGVTSNGANASVSLSNLTVVQNSGAGTQSISAGKLVSFENSFLADNNQGFTPITPTHPTQPTGGQIWLSGVGSDANPGGRTNPMRSLTSALAATTAGGEIDLLDPASIGQATINHSVTVDGTGVVMAGITVTSGSGIVINAGAGDVVILRHLTFNGLGTPGSGGIQILQAAAVYIEDCTFGGIL